MPGPAELRPRRALWILAALVLIAAALPLAQVQLRETRRTWCQTNLRWLGQALWAYAADYDGCLPPAESRAESGAGRTWVDAAEPYMREFEDRRDLAQCPANPVPDSALSPRGTPFSGSYALNARFFGVFEQGPFPLYNLEIPERTALLVEGGGRRPEPAYWDAAANPRAYPSPHAGEMNVAAADGHVVRIRVRYSAEGHDALLGRLGGAIYNWNGGRPNGRTELPPRE